MWFCYRKFSKTFSIFLCEFYSFWGEDNLLNINSIKFLIFTQLSTPYDIIATFAFALTIPIPRNTRLSLSIEHQYLCGTSCEDCHSTNYLPHPFWLSGYPLLYFYGEATQRNLHLLSSLRWQSDQGFAGVHRIAWVTHHMLRIVSTILDISISYEHREHHRQYKYR